MKAIQAILKERTCNLFSDEWYNATALQIKIIAEIQLETHDTYKHDPQFASYNHDVRYYNDEISGMPMTEKRTYIKNLGVFCVMNNKILIKGRDHRGRYFIITSS